MTTDTSNLLRSEAELLLEQARQTKSERIKDLGDPVHLAGKALDLRVVGDHAWIAENTAVARRLDLETGKTVQLYKGHTGPVTCLAFCDRSDRLGDQDILLTGSWDQTIKVWDTIDRAEISSTKAHDDFVKTLFVIRALRLLVSGSSDKVVRFWDLASISSQVPLRSIGAITTHTRPVECVDGYAESASSAVLYTADTMGAIKIWNVTREPGGDRWKSTLRQEIDIHRTRVNEIICGVDQFWTASSDETVRITQENGKKSQVIQHRLSVRCLLPLLLSDVAEPYLLTGAGDAIYAYDLTTQDEPELLGEIDGHWHDVTALRLWMRKSSVAGRGFREPFIVSASLDGTIRKWNLRDLLTPKPKGQVEEISRMSPVDTKEKSAFQISEEEERELAELLDSD